MSRAVQADKVTLARESRGYTQAELAERSHISQGQISKIELGMLHASDEQVVNLSNALNYPEALFFLTDPVYGAGPNDLYHRKRQSASVKLMKKIYAHINLRRIHIVQLLKSVALGCHVPKYPIEENTDGGEVGIAAMVRAAWHLPAGPIANLTEYLERAGAIIVPCDFETPLVDGISQWLPGHPPMFFMNMGIARSRWRMTLAHELAHNVMHAMPNEDMEGQANRFAAEFLMPTADIRGDLSFLFGCRRADDVLSKLAELKLIWKVSMQGLLTKAADLRILPPALVTSVWKRLAQLGYRRHEPYEHRLPLEQPTTLRELITRHTTRLGYSIPQLAEAVHLTAEEFRQLYMPAEAAHLRAV